MPRKVLRWFKRPALSFRILQHRFLFWFGALLVSLVAMVFAQSSLMGNAVFLHLIQAYPNSVFVVTPLAFAGISWLTRRVFTGAEGSGIPQTMAALEIPVLSERRSVLSLRVALGKVLLTTLALCAGASVGREGPTVQVGASIMHSLGRWIRMPINGKEHALILAGGAAGISAAFNTPLAGVVFVIEEMSHSFHSRTSGAVLAGVIIAGIGSMAVMGNYAYFGHVEVGLTVLQAWRPVLFCGVICGLLGGLFARILIGFSRGVPGSVGGVIRTYPVVFAGMCGLGLAVVGHFSGDSVYGTGYEQAKGLIEGNSNLGAEFAPLKIAATILSYISGIPGGIFAPSLSIGAGLGADIGHWTPDLPLGAIIVLGMVGYFTGVVQAPITAVVIVMEITDNQALLIPLMATALIAFGTSRMVCPVPFYRALSVAFLKREKRRQERV